MNDHKIVQKKARTVTAEDKKNTLKEEYKVMRDESRNNLVKKGNDKIHILMNDFEEEEDDDRFRKISNSRSFNRSINQSSEEHKKIKKINKPKINKKNSDVANLSASNRSNNSTILEQMMGFTNENEEHPYKGKVSKYLPPIAKNNFIANSIPDNTHNLGFSRSFHKADRNTKFENSRSNESLVEHRSITDDREKSKILNNNALDLTPYGMDRIDEELSSLASRFQTPKLISHLDADNSR